MIMKYVQEKSLWISNLSGSQFINEYIVAYLQSYNKSCNKQQYACECKRILPICWTTQPLSTSSRVSIRLLLIIFMGIVFAELIPLSVFASGFDSLQERHLKQQPLFSLLSAQSPTLNEGLNRMQAKPDVLTDNKYLQTEKFSFLENDDGPYEKLNSDFVLPAINQDIECPKECKCLNDYFICNRKHLSYVPLLPQYVQAL